MHENILKLYNVYNRIFDNQIDEYLESLKKDDKILKEIFIFLSAAKNSIDNCFTLMENDEYIDSLCLLRSSFETIMLAIAIYFDKEIYDMYKFYDKDTYYIFLKRKYKKEKQKNPKFKTSFSENWSKDFLKPYRIRKVVAENYKCLFSELFANCKNEKEVEEELNAFYKYLCDFAHPSIVKTYVFKIQNDRENLENIRALFRLNINYCKILLLLALNYFSTDDDISKIYELYAIVFLLGIIQIDNAENFKAVLKKYEEFLYLDIHRKYFNNNKNEIEKMQSEMKELSENSIEGITECMQDIIEKFDAQSILKEYF